MDDNTALVPVTHRPDPPASVTPEQVREQRAKGWPDWHPEAYCHRCGAKNVSWWVDSPLWEAVTERPYVIWCMTCFVIVAEEKGLASNWTLVPHVAGVRLQAREINYRALPWHDDEGRRFDWDTGLYELADDDPRRQVGD